MIQWVIFIVININWWTVPLRGASQLMSCSIGPWDYLYNSFSGSHWPVGCVNKAISRSFVSGKKPPSIIGPPPLTAPTSAQDPSLASTRKPTYMSTNLHYALSSAIYHILTRPTHFTHHLWLTISNGAENDRHDFLLAKQLILAILCEVVKSSSKVSVQTGNLSTWLFQYLRQEFTIC